MELRQEVFSSDGYIIRQHKTDTVTFGACPNSQNGCGWIAAYNLLRATLHPLPWQKVHGDLSRQLIGGGKRGLHLMVLMGYLKQQGCHLRCATTLTGGRLLAERSRAGIILYGTGQTTHYVTFIRQPDGRLRFLNAGPGRDDITLSLREFYRDIVAFPVVFVVGAK